MKNIYSSQASEEHFNTNLLTEANNYISRKATLRGGHFPL